MEGIFTIIGIIVGCFVTIFGTKKFAQKVYNETGYNALEKTNKFLMGFMFVLPIVVALIMGSNPNNAIIILCFLIPFVVLVVRNLKAKSVSNIIILTVLQTIGGLFIILFGILKIVLSVVGLGGKGKPILNLDIDTTQKEVNNLNNSVDKINIQQDENNESIKQEELDKANAYAQKQGFEDADEAEFNGIKTGKPE